MNRKTEDIRFSIFKKYRGVEQWQLVGPITRRSPVRIRPPQQEENTGLFLYFLFLRSDEKQGAPERERSEWSGVNPAPATNKKTG